MLLESCSITIENEIRDIEINNIYTKFIPLYNLIFVPSFILLYTSKIFVLINIYPNKQNISGSITPTSTHIMPLENPNRENILHIYIPILVHFKMIRNNKARGVYMNIKVK